MRIMELNEVRKREWLAELESSRESSTAEARAVAAKIIARVRKDGDRAVATILSEIDGVGLEAGELCVRPLPGDAAAEIRGAIEVAAGRIEAIHARQLGRIAMSSSDPELRQDLVPLERVGVYVPGGAAVYLSTLMMCAIPARVAGVRQLVVATTPRVAARPEFNLVCRMLGISAIYRAGGAAGIAAMAFGTESLPRVDKIVGPGNRFVSAAKELVRDRVGIDLQAGPSEIVVIADDNADAGSIAADMLAQAEHGPDSLAVCVTSSPRIAEEIADEVERRLVEPCAAAARPAIEAFGAILVASSIEEAVALAEAIAPEHLSLQVADCESIAERIRNCSAIFVGTGSAVALGDYVAGSNHVLPTAGAARYCGSLGVSDFLKRRTIVQISAATLREIAPAAVTLAEFEGLPLHAASVRERLAREAGPTRTTELQGEGRR